MITLVVLAVLLDGYLSPLAWFAVLAGTMAKARRQ